MRNDFRARADLADRFRLINVWPFGHHLRVCVDIPNPVRHQVNVVGKGQWILKIHASSAKKIEIPCGVLILFWPAFQSRLQTPPVFGRARLAEPDPVRMLREDAGPDAAPGEVAVQFSGPVGAD